MAGSARYTVVLDACVLYPAPVRDLLLNSARLHLTAEKMASAIPDSQITGYERYTAIVTLPDPDDRHVVAAAIAGHADAIVTFNLKDFPAETMESFGLEAQHPDDFVVNQLHLNLIEALKGIKAQRARLNKPALTPSEFLAVIARCGLPQTASLLADSVELI